MNLYKNWIKEGVRAKDKKKSENAVKIVKSGKNKRIENIKLKPINRKTIKDPK